jgi:transposase-like protein
MRRRHDPAELRRLVLLREREGLSYAKLAKETGNPIGTLASWSHRVRQERSEQERSAPRAVASDFIEVVPTGHGRLSGDIEVHLADGVVVQVPSRTDRPTVMRLLSAILSC